MLMFIFIIIFYILYIYSRILLLLTYLVEIREYCVISNIELGWKLFTEK